MIYLHELEIHGMIAKLHQSLDYILQNEEELYILV